MTIEEYYFQLIEYLGIHPAWIWVSMVVITTCIFLLISDLQRIKKRKRADVYFNPNKSFSTEERVNRQELESKAQKIAEEKAVNISKNTNTDKPKSVTVETKKAEVKQKQAQKKKEDKYYYPFEELEEENQKENYQILNKIKELSEDPKSTEPNSQNGIKANPKPKSKLPSSFEEISQNTTEKLFVN